MLNQKFATSLCEKWEPILEGITDESTRQMTAVLLENQAKSILSENSQDHGTLEEATTVGNLGTFQKFAFPLVRRVFPQLIANKICGVQPMQGPVSQIFYLGYNRAGIAANGTARGEVVYSKYRMVYGGNIAGTQNNIGSLDSNAGITASGNFAYSGTPAGLGLSAMTTMGSGTAGGKIAAFPNENLLAAQYFVSAGERLSASAIPEVNFTIEQQAVTARTRKFRALWTLEASQDLRAYHNLDLERELTELLSKEVALEIDRELVESIRSLAYDFPITGTGSADARKTFGRNNWNQANANSFGESLEGGAQGSFDYQQPFGRINAGTAGAAVNTAGQPNSNYGGVGVDDVMPTTAGNGSNVFFVDFGTTALGLAPRHVGEVYANLVAVVNFAAQDIYRTTLRGAGNWVVCSPLVAAMLQSAAKLEGGVDPSEAGQLGATIEYKGKWMGTYDVYVDPLYPEDELMVGYKGSSPMDAGFVYSPYIPLQMLPTITDPETFQPRKGLITRYATTQINPASRFYRIIRIVGADSRYLTTPFQKAGGITSPVY